MDDQRIEDVVRRHRATLLEDFRTPAVELLESRAQKALPLSVREFFRLGERLFGSEFVIDCGLLLRVQNFAPLNSAAIDACERREWRFLDIACGDEGERLLVSLDQAPRLFVDWLDSGPLEDTRVGFADFLAEVQRVVSTGRAAEPGATSDAAAM